MKKLQVGESYKDNRGTVYTVTCITNHHEYPYQVQEGSNGALYGYTEDGKFDVSRKSEFDLIIPDEPQVQQPVQPEVKPEVPHLDVILAIVQKIPVQFQVTGYDKWYDYETTDPTDLNPVDSLEYNWRIKPQPEPKRTVQIGKRTVVAPEVEVPKVGAKYYTPLGNCPMTWKNDAFDNKYLKVGRVFLTKESADSFQEALESLIFGKD